MRSPFRSQIKVTQAFGGNYDYYKQFGLKGHEGLDLIPTGTVWDVLCLADGIVVTDSDNPASGAYGVFVTVWHPTLRKATQYCHFKENYVKNGDRVVMGQKLGLMGSSGNTRGAHLHLNLYETDENGVRLNKANGYNGGIDPLVWMQSLTDSPAPVTTIQIETSVFENLVRKSTIYDKIRAKLEVEDSETTVIGEVDKLIGYEDKVIEKDRQLEQLRLEMNELQARLNVQADKQKEALEKVDELTLEVDKAKTIVQTLTSANEVAQAALISLQQQTALTPLTGFRKFLFDTFIRGR